MPKREKTHFNFLRAPTLKPDAPIRARIRARNRARYVAQYVAPKNAQKGLSGLRAGALTKLKCIFSL